MFAYQIEAVLPGDASEINRFSNFFFAAASTMPALSQAGVRLNGRPMIEATLLNKVSQGDRPDNPHVDANEPEDQTFCHVEYGLSTSNIFNEVLLTTPLASDSAVTGEKCASIGSFRSNRPDAPLRYDRLVRIDTRSYRHNVPFYDSQVWLQVGVADTWDRTIEDWNSAAVTPEIIYRGKCAPLELATCNGTDRTVSLKLSTATSWRADRLARGWKDEDRPDGVLRFLGNPSPNPHDDEKLDGEHGRESDDGGERDQPAVDLPALASLIAELSKWIAGRSMAGGARCKSGHRQCRRLHHRRCANAGFRKRT